MRTLLIAASLLTLGVLGAQPASACTSVVGAPGTASGGVLGFTEWYAHADAYAACAAGEAVEASAVQRANAAVATVTPVAGGVGSLVHADNLVPAAEGYAVATAGVAQSEHFDVCSGFLGATNPPCLTDVPVSQTQSCDTTVPHPVGGAIGSTLENANSQLQQTCQLYLVAGTAVPSQAEANAFVAAASTGAGAFVASVAGAPGALAAAAGSAATGLGNEALLNTCVWLQDDPGCLS